MTHVHTQPMRRTQLWLAAAGQATPWLAVALLTAGLATNASAAPDTAAVPSALTRAQVRMDRDEFIRTHTWDPGDEVWVLKPGFEPPMGMKSRAQVAAERDLYLSTHQWNEELGWVPLPGAPRDISTLKREQVREETRQFLKTHRWDEFNEAWVLKPVAAPKR